MDGAVDLRTGSMVFSEKGTLNDTYQWLLDDEATANAEPCPACCYTHLCVTKCYSITAAFAFVFLVIAIIVGIASIQTIRGYAYTKPLLRAQCTTLETEVTGEWVECECKRGDSVFPCTRIQVYVEIGTNTSSGNVSRTLLRMSEADLQQIPPQVMYIINLINRINLINLSLLYY